MNRTNLFSLLAALLYGGFALWCTPLGGPLRADEIERYVATMTERGADGDGLRRSGVGLGAGPGGIELEAAAAS